MNDNKRIIFYIFFLVTVLFGNSVFAQNTFRAIIRDADTKEVLIGASAAIIGTTIGNVADANGIVTIQNIPDGEQIIEFSYIGYETKQQRFTFPLLNNDTISVFLEDASSELGEVVISSTRSNRSIANIPTRIEFIGLEEIEENGNMNPGGIRIWERFSIYVNCENLSNVRQTRFESIYSGTRTNPVFKDIFAPLDGFVVNTGIKIKL